MGSPVKTYGIGGALGVALGLIATAIQWKYPEYKNLANGMLILAGLIVFGAMVAAVVRSLTIRDYERQRLVTPPAQRLTQTANPHNEFKPTFQPTVNVSVPGSQTNQQQVNREQKVTRDPVFECRGTRFRRYGFNMQTGELIREQYDGDPSQVYEYIKFVNVGLAKFLYRPDPGVDARLRVNAHVFIHGDDDRLPRIGQLTPDGLKVWFKNQESTDIYKPIWDDDEPHASVEFSAGYTHELVVALVPATEQPRGVIVYEYGTKRVESYMGSERVFQPEIYDLAGQRFFIRIELIPKLWNDVRCKLPAFWFELFLELPQPILAFLGTVDG